MKKFGVVAVSVTAGLLVASPLASAADRDHGSGSGGTNNTCVAEPGANGSTSSSGQCTTSGQNNGQGNTFNGMPVPGFPDFPAIPFP